MKLTIHEIVMKLVGPIVAIGDCREDEQRMKNLGEAIALADLLLGEILLAAADHVRDEASMKAIGNDANEFVGYLREKFHPPYDPDYVLMPRSLNAKNGSKALLSGEFAEAVEVDCPICDGSGVDAILRECGTCKGTATVTQTTDVSWTTIKKIYAMAVEHFEKESERNP